jgi:phosphoribosylaminoimidazolecarboxamide formyltransferase/IMP cyclohydrolase
MKTALISVSNKDGLEELIPILEKYDFRVISSGGTARKIRSLGYDVTEVSDYTGYPESPDGLIKTLQPKIHGGILLNPDNPTHNKYMKQQGIKPIDLVVVNLYPFEKVIQEDRVDFYKVVNNIDIGGSAMIRAAVKGALLKGSPVVVTDPKQYILVIDELEKNDGNILPVVVSYLAVEAIKRTQSYDSAIMNYMDRL